MTDKLRDAAQAIVDRWDSPAWGGSAENLRHTGEYIAALRAALAQQDAQAAPQPSPTAGMNIAQRILHVGGRNNAAGYVEFGSIQAVEALVRQVIRDLPELVELESLRHNVKVYREATALTLNAGPAPSEQLPEVRQWTGLTDIGVYFAITAAGKPPNPMSEEFFTWCEKFADAIEANLKERNA